VTDETHWQPDSVKSTLTGTDGIRGSKQPPMRFVLKLLPSSDRLAPRIVILQRPFHKGLQCPYVHGKALAC
jgi:hypothetical protein